MLEELPLKFIVGLGNPGREYEGTRHNIGFTLLDNLAQRYSLTWKHEPKWNLQIARYSPAPDHHWIIAKPMTFMNLSGAAVAPYARFFRILPTEILVVSDDVHLPLTSLRLRRQGSSGGQRGLESILIHLSTQKIPRLRIGVGPLPLQESHPTPIKANSLPHYVLSKFLPEEKNTLQQTIIKATDALEMAIEKGLGNAMSHYN